MHHTLLDFNEVNVETERLAALIRYIRYKYLVVGYLLIVLRFLFKMIFIEILSTFNSRINLENLKSWPGLYAHHWV